MGGNIRLLVMIIFLATTQAPQVKAGGVEVEAGRLWVEEHLQSAVPDRRPDAGPV